MVLSKRQLLHRPIGKWGLRDYGLEPAVWDGDNECNHEWGDNNHCPAKIGKQGSTETVKHPAFTVSIGKPTGSQYCIKCGALREIIIHFDNPFHTIKHVVFTPLVAEGVYYWTLATKCTNCDVPTEHLYSYRCKELLC